MWQKQLRRYNNISKPLGLAAIYFPSSNIITNRILKGEIKLKAPVSFICWKQEN
jgi:hypothetical protein